MKLTTRFVQGAFVLATGILIGRWTNPVSTVSAQETLIKGGELSIGTIPLSIGMQKAPVLVALRKQYKLEPSAGKISGAEFWHIKSSEDDFSYVGSVQFRQDRLINISRQWGLIRADSALVSFFQKVYGAFESAGSRTKFGTLTCTISREPDKTLTVINLQFANRSIDLFLSEDRLPDGTFYRPLTIQENVAAIF